MALPNEDHKHRVVVFQPNTRWYGKRPWFQVSYTIGLLTALLKDEVELHLLDANIEDLTEDQALARLREHDPDMIMISGLSVEYFQQYHTSFDLAKKASSRCITVFGGIYPTLMPAEAIQDRNIDYVFCGHAEGRIAPFVRLVFANDLDGLAAFPGLAFRTGSGVQINPVDGCLSQDHAWIQPDYSLMDVGSYVRTKTKDALNDTSGGANAAIFTSFGCPQDCAFCASKTITGQRVAFRPVDHVLDEIDWYMKAHDVRNITFVDENFLARRSRVESILRAFIDRGYNLKWQMANVAVWHLDDGLLSLMKESGCTAIGPSIESGSRRVLRDVIRKPPTILDKAPAVIRKCKELGIDVITHFVVGMPGETWEEIRETFRCAETLDADMSVFHIATPYPGTDLYREAKSQGLLPENFSFFSPEFWGTSRGFISTREFSPFELMVLRAFEWDRINFRTPERTAKIARMMRMTPEQLEEHRRETRRHCGVHY